MFSNEPSLRTFSQTENAPPTQPGQRCCPHRHCCPRSHCPNLETTRRFVLRLTPHRCEPRAKTEGSRTSYCCLFSPKRSKGKTCTSLKGKYNGSVKVTNTVRALSPLRLLNIYVYVMFAQSMLMQTEESEKKLLWNLFMCPVTGEVPEHNVTFGLVRLAHSQSSCLHCNWEWIRWRH